ncbi:glycosyltransferase family 2 protein [Methanococcus maripaludis]|uniref:Glycosyltransferase involved in cell wall biosynthesis n=1 Tax=Methanococcus maripaludis TaxID=39152 RepID=A0A8T4CQS0_METMI|nr:glycosyltransferase [Methanococcus maripaludis]MBM7409116.1 glycosyltransferase involved in cell wall biosynthesis [Methanococcus maripaludis]MBP2218698.1 glycosyltransferase involved in cell wall biosynthesis [Methanococcus maripaludis]
MNGIENNPTVSVIMPNYNNEKYLPEAIESILNQTYENFEFIIIDDCSTDNSWKIIQKYAEKDNRIKAFRNEKNLKIVKTRNKGFKLMSSNSKYIAIFDSDDISMPERLEKQVAFLEKNPDYGLVGSHTLIIDENSEIIGYRKYETDFKKIIKNMLKKNQFAQPSVMIRKSAIYNVGFYDDEFEVCEDYDLWFKFAKNYKIINIDEFLLKYRISNTQSKSTKLKKTLIYTLKVQKKWLFDKKFFNIFGLIYYGLEHLMYFLPSKVVLKLFKVLNYEKA